MPGDQPLSSENIDPLIMALNYAKRGWYVFPCKPDKRPQWHEQDLPHGKDNATTNPEQICTWWERWPGSLIGIYCEMSGIFALDIDVKDDRNGWDSLEELRQKYGEGRDIMAGPIQRTPSGGCHMIFSRPAGINIPNNSNKLAPGLDLRSNGYICTGKGYSWLPDHGPETMLTTAPGWLIALIESMGHKSSPEGLPSVPTRKFDDSGEHFLTKALQKAIPGQRNQAGFDLACQLRDSRAVSLSEAEAIMRAYAARVPQSAGNLYTEDEALASLRSAWNGQPREPARSQNGNGYHHPFDAPTEQISDPEEPPVWIDELPPAPPDELNRGQQALPAKLGQAEQGSKKPPIPTDPQLAGRCVSKHPGRAWYVDFRQYEGGIWPILPDDIVRGEVLQELENAQAEGVRPTSRMISSVTEIIRLKVAVPPEKWDADPDYLICANGALHIPTRTLEPHKPELYATSRLDFDYDPKAKAPVFERVIHRAIPEAAGFLQEFAGLALTTDTKYELAVWLFGPHGSGKSTILTGLQAMLGDRAGILGLADIERSRFALTSLPGKTLMVSAEQPSGYMAATYALNAIISGEPITVDRKFKEPIKLIPRAKLAWAMNDLPRVSEAGSGLFRRVKVIRFPVLPEDERDPNVKEQVKLEGAGILNWALEGLARLRARGRFEIPKCVQDATAHFQETNDVPALFVSEQCLTGDQYRTQASMLYQAYKNWCVENGHKPQSSTSVAEDWRRLGFDKKAINGRNFWAGVGLVEGVDT